MPEKPLESPLDSKEIKPVNLKRNQPWIFIGKCDAESEYSYFGQLMQRANSLDKTLIRPFRWNDWRQKEKRVAEDETVGWHHQLDWTWLWTNSWIELRTGKPGVLQSMGLQRVRHNLVIEHYLDHHASISYQYYVKDQVCSLKFILWNNQSPFNEM